MNSVQINICLYSFQEEEEPEVIEVQDEETVSSSGLNLTEKEAKMIGKFIEFIK